MRYTMSKDGERRVTLHVPVRLTKTEIAFLKSRMELHGCTSVHQLLRSFIDNGMFRDQESAEQEAEDENRGGWRGVK